VSLEYKRVVPQGTNFLERSWRRISAIWMSLRRFLRKLILPTLLIGLSVFVYVVFLNPLEDTPKEPLQALLFVLELMTLEAAEDLPTHPAIICFWLAMPVLGLFVLGKVVEGILFSSGMILNQEQRDLWEEAMASTFRNHIIVYALNDLSRYLIDQLSQRNYPIVLVAFRLTSAEDNHYSSRGIPVIVRQPRYARDALDKAGARFARAVLITTHIDSEPELDMNEVNTIAASRAREYSANSAIIARIKDPTYAMILENKNVRIIPSISALSVWPFIGAAYGVAISQPIVVGEDDTGATVNFIVEMDVRPGSLLGQMTVDEVETDGLDVMLHRPSDQHGPLVIPPPGDEVIEDGDEIIAFAQQERLHRLLQLNHPQDMPLKTVVVAGMNTLGLLVTAALLGIGVSVYTLDNYMAEDEANERLNRIAKPRNGARHLGHGYADRWSPALLRQAKLDEAQALLICGGHDPENLTLAALAKRLCGAQPINVVARINRDSYREFYQDISLNVRLFRLSELGAGPFMDIAVGAELSPVEFEYDRRMYQLIMLRVNGGLLDGKPRRQTVTGFQQDTRTDIVLLHTKGSAPIVHPDSDHPVRYGDTLVIFGPEAAVRKVADSNR